MEPRPRAPRKAACLSTVTASRKVCLPRHRGPALPGTAVSRPRGRPSMSRDRRGLRWSPGCRCCGRGSFHPAARWDFCPHSGRVSVKPPEPAAAAEPVPSGPAGPVQGLGVPARPGGLRGACPGRPWPGGVPWALWGCSGAPSSAVPTSGSTKTGRGKAGSLRRLPCSACSEGSAPQVSHLRWWVQW